jgi:hypothetical protein
LCFVEQDRLVGQPTEPISISKYNIKGEKTEIRTQAAPGFSVEETTPTLLSRAIQKIEDHATNGNPQPFFLYYASPSPTSPGYR